MKKWLICKIVLSALNKLLAARKGETQNAVNIVSRWISRLQAIIACFRGLCEKLSDGEINAEEANAIKAEIADIIRKW